MSAVCAGVAAAALLSKSAGSACERAALAPDAWRVIAVVAGAEDPATASALAAVGANVLATLSPPDPLTDAACASAGLRYLARIPASDVAALPFHPERVAEIRSMRSLVALQVIDLDALEGYETPQTMALAYGTLKALFPDLQVVHAIRLDPIGWDPGYLDAYYRPELCDVVAPYFYPVGTTYLGTFEDDDPWADVLRDLLAEVAARTPAGKPILPVLQAFQQSGHPVSRALIDRQLAVYREIWPEPAGVAAFWWGGGLDEPLTGLAGRADLRTAVASVFGAAPSRARPCETGASRPPVQSAP
jgi:hypothetical protein